MNQDKRIALLIDAENITRNYCDIIFSELARYGTVTYRRIYGDFVKNNNINWREKDFLEYSLTPVQQFSYTTGKNSSDITLVIDAMDILYSGKIDMFCIVSSDSDYTKLVSRLRESGLSVIGMGEAKTPTALRNACEKFVLLDKIYKSNIKTADKSAADKKTDKVKQKQSSRSGAKTTCGDTAVESPAAEKSADDDNILSLAELIEVISNTILPDLEADNGWASLADVGNRLTKLYVDFDSRNYGYQKLSQLIKSQNCFEIDTQAGENRSTVYFIRKKQ